MLRKTEGAVVLSVRLSPGASADRVGGVEQAADGSSRLKIFVRAVPEKGKANKALVDLLAKRMKLRKSDFAVVSGKTSRNKELRIAGEPDELAALIEGLAKN